MWIETALLAWTAAAFCWWIVSAWSVRSKPLPPAPLREAGPAPLLTVFKPLPRLFDHANFERTAQAVGSFVGQLDEGSEMILGVHPDELVKWKEVIKHWRKTFPSAALNIVIPDEDHGTNRYANRKVAWQSVLAPHARGELWMWSDADITAPPGFLKNSLREYQVSGAGLLTNAYIVRSVQSVPDFLNALYVNAEIYPGVRFIGKKQTICFGLGAALLFSKKDFGEKISWDELGSCLADDHYLGTHLPPARLGSDVLQTYSGSGTLKESVLHYLRWQKTIRWCQPAGFAAQLAVMPTLAWLVYAAVSLNPFAWAGFAIVAALEACWVALLFRFTGCPLPLRFYGLIPVWSVFRILAFAACWFPWPVIWRSQAWWKPVRRIQGD